jgi:hypothetical protein
VAVAPSFDDVVGELYALPPPEFVAAREERAKAARAAGDRALAGQIHALRRPTLGAWMVNLLAHERPELLRQLVELGGELREAQENLRGEDMRALNAQRQQVVSGLVGEARRLAREAGEKPGDDAAYEVERTLLAALADPEVGEQVTGGALVRPLDYSGFGPVSRADVVTRPRPVRRGDRPATGPAETGGRDDLATARRRRARADAEAAVRAAEESVRAARRESRRAAANAEQLAAARQRADEEVERLRRQLAEAEEAAGGARDAEDGARKTAEEAEARTAEAAGRHAEARGHLEGLPSAT